MMQRWLYRVVRCIVLVPCAVLFRIRIRGRANLPATGAYVLAPSHRSVLDIFFLPYVTTRRIRFMGKKEWWDKPLFAKVFTALGAFPVDRDGADRSALKAALAAVADGEPVAIFPEGTRAHGRVLGDLHEGVAYVALKAGVPIVPVGIGGTEAILPSGVAFPRFKRASVVIGPPITVERVNGAIKRSQMSELTKTLRERLQPVFDEAEGLAGN